tara:strand:- start:48 stop:500 length:453 start_codon:yes stop_codon:yes gene_type:complete
MNYLGNETFDKDGLLVPNLLGEEWKGWPVIEENPYYQVSTHGRFRRIIGKGWQLINPQKQASGQITVSVNDNGSQKTKALKKIVAEVWVPNQNQLPNVRLRDKELPMISSNLEWYNFKESKSVRKEIRTKILAKIDKLCMSELEVLLDRL